MEADFNWLNKLVFAKRMMDQAFNAGNVPLEQFARRGTQAAHGVLCKVLFCDYVWALHIVAGIPSMDLGNCYDAVSHLISNSKYRVAGIQIPLTGGSLGSFSPSNNDLLSIRTGYGVSRNDYDGKLAILPLDWDKATGWLLLDLLQSALSWTSHTNIWVMLPLPLLVRGLVCSLSWPQLSMLMKRIS
jgi:hypothetical protein